MVRRQQHGIRESQRQRDLFADGFLRLPFQRQHDRRDHHQRFYLRHYRERDDDDDGQWLAGLRCNFGDDVRRQRIGQRHVHHEQQLRAKPVRDDRPSKRLVVAGQRRLVDGRHHQRHVDDLTRTTRPTARPTAPTTASPLNYIPDPWPAFGGPGPEPGAAGVYTAVISQIVPTGGGVDLPGGDDGDGNPAIAASQWNANSFTYLFGQPTLPSDPSGLFIFSPPGDTMILPAPADATTYSLAAAGEAVFGMDFAPVAGNGAAQFAPSFAVGGGPQAPGTEFATGNNPASLPAFTSETIAGPFGRNSAAAFPMTHSSTLVTYATAGVSAGVTAPATGSLVGAHSGARIVPTSSHAATSRRQHPRAIGAIQRGECRRT